MEKKYDKIVIGLDQSYTRSGISIVGDNKLLKVTSIPFRGCKIKSDKRKVLANTLHKVIPKALSRSNVVIILCERIRTFSHNSNDSKGGKDNDKGPNKHSGMFISTDYIKATGALIATIVDTAYEYNVPVYSVDTRSWKSQILGNSKGSKKDGNKLQAVNFIMNKGFDISSTNKKGKVVYNDDAADSACIALYGFIENDKQKLKKEE